MKRLIKRLNKALEDPQYRQGWISNLATSYTDAEDKYRATLGKKYLNMDDRRTIAYNAAYAFLRLLKG